MANTRFDDARTMIKIIQDGIDPLAVKLNAANPKHGGPGLDPETTHKMIGSLLASTNNLAIAVEQIIDYLNEQHDAAETTN